MTREDGNLWDEENWEEVTYEEFAGYEGASIMVYPDSSNTPVCYLPVDR